MKRMPYLRLAVAVFAGLYLQSCALDEYFESRLEKYTKSFIKEFGLVDPEQDWTMGKNENAEINVGPVAKSVKIYGKYGDTYYKVADLADIGGSLSVPVHVPKTCTEMMVRVDGRKYYGSFGKKLDCTGISGRGIAVTDKDQKENRNPTSYTWTVDGYTVEIKHTNSGNDPDNKAYQRFNTQQMGPLVANDEWKDYYSLNTGEMNYNINGDIGLLPESGSFNANKTYLDNVLANSVSDVAVDFSIDAGENGAFTIFPYYYGTNLVHELGIYLLDDYGEPMEDKNGNYIKLPIFVDNDEGDMQIQPHYCSTINDIKVFDQYGDEVKWDNPIRLDVGETYNLDVRLYDANNDEIKYDDAFKKKYHSRIAFHAWVDDKVRYTDGIPSPVNGARFGKVFVTCDANGKITAKLDTHDEKYGFENDGQYWMQTGIATGLSGMEINGKDKDFPIIVTDPNKTNGNEIKDHVFVPEGVGRLIGKYTSNKSSIYGQNTGGGNFTNIPGLEKWGKTGCGIASDEFKHCLYQRDEDGQLIFDNNNNLLLAADKVKLLFEDIKESIKNKSFKFQGEWDSFKFSSDQYELAGLNFLNKDTNENWLQFDIYLQERGTESTSIKSRAEIPADYREMLTETEEYGGWTDVHRSWSRYLPAGKEVASYPVDQPMLARTRGYDVKIKITNPDGSSEPYRGKFGMYVSIKEAFNNDEAVLQNVTPYTLYSQQRLNDFGQRSAAAFVHPRSNRTFFTFEDMNLTHLAEDEGGYKYGEYEFSSDRDVNDLIFLIDGIEEIDGDKTITVEEKVVEDGFSWIWALEDLGSTGDFDFNDVVIRIKDITKTTKTTTTTTTENGQTTTTTKDEIIITPEITFMPLAAGGTLPIHIHFRYVDKYGKENDFVLAPGKYDLTNGQSPSELKTGKEFHKWFDESISSSTMINTGVTAPISTSEKNACILIVDEGFKLENSLKFEKGSHGDGSNQSVLYVVVQGDGTEPWSLMQKVDQDRMKDKDAYMLPLMEKGKAAQSFFILDKNGGTWRWMKEYQHICLGYPGFAEWIKNPGTDWTEDKDTEFLY